MDAWVEITSVQGLANQRIGRGISTKTFGCVASVAAPTYYALPAGPTLMVARNTQGLTIAALGKLAGDSAHGVETLDRSPRSFTR